MIFDNAAKFIRFWVESFHTAIKGNAEVEFDLIQEILPPKTRNTPILAGLNVAKYLELLLKVTKRIVVKVGGSSDEEVDGAIEYSDSLSAGCFAC